MNQLEIDYISIKLLHERAERAGVTTDPGAYHTLEPTMQQLDLWSLLGNLATPRT